MELCRTCGSPASFEKVGTGLYLVRSFEKDETLQKPPIEEKALKNDNRIIISKGSPSISVLLDTPAFLQAWSLPVQTEQPKAQTL